MQRTVLIGLFAGAVLSGCATDGIAPMSQEQIADCLQPNRRVVVEFSGIRPLPAPKPKPGAAAPEAKPEAKPKVAMGPLELQAQVQGKSAFDISSAILKQGGMDEINELLADAKKQNMQIGAVIVAGYVDRIEASSGMSALSEERAKSVLAYLVSNGIDPKLVFWEGRGARDPVPVTKFCS